MKRCIITTVTATMSYKINHILSVNGIKGETVKLPPSLTGKGCAFGVQIDCTDEYRAASIMSLYDVSYGKIVRTEI